MNKSKLLYGFGSKPNTLERGALQTVRASLNDTQDTQGESGDLEEEKLSEIKEEQNEVTEKPKFKPVYAFFVLGLVLICRIMVQWHR